MSRTRAERAASLERWADDVEADDLQLADTATLRRIVELVEEKAQVDEALELAVRAARTQHRSWSEIGAMLGVSKQAAHRKYGRDRSSAGS